MYRNLKLRKEEKERSNSAVHGWIYIAIASHMPFFQSVSYQ
jgi:hypothetical protein